jgi:hypothetical protein
MSNLLCLGERNRPAPDEFTSVGDLLSRAGGHMIGLPISAMVKSAGDVTNTRNAREHTVDFHLEVG